MVLTENGLGLLQIDFPPTIKGHVENVSTSDTSARMEVLLSFPVGKRDAYCRRPRPESNLKSHTTKAQNPAMRNDSMY